MSYGVHGHIALVHGLCAMSFIMATCFYVIGMRCWVLLRLSRKREIVGSEGVLITCFSYDNMAGTITRGLTTVAKTSLCRVGPRIPCARTSLS